jgi:uncharacterized protein DUF4136
VIAIVLDYWRKGLFSMRLTLWLALLILGLSVMIAPSAPAQKTSTSFDDKFSFLQHKRYAWRENRLMTRQPPDTNELMDLKIVKAVNQLLSAKGFTEVKDKPDFYLYYGWRR